eukprot:1146307-Pelagomonas_calceolata.AAC.4
MPGDSYRGPIGCKHQVMQSGSVWPGFPWKVATPALTSGHSTAVTLVSQLPRRFQCGFATWLGNICLNVRSSCIVITRPLRLRRKSSKSSTWMSAHVSPHYHALSALKHNRRGIWQQYSGGWSLTAHLTCSASEHHFLCFRTGANPMNPSLVQLQNRHKF